MCVCVWGGGGRASVATCKQLIDVISLVVMHHANPAVICISHLHYLLALTVCALCSLCDVMFTFSYPFYFSCHMLNILYPLLHQYFRALHCCWVGVSVVLRCVVVGLCCVVVCVCGCGVVFVWVHRACKFHSNGDNARLIPKDETSFSFLIA